MAGVTFVIGVVVGVVLTVIFAILVVRMQRERRRLGYEVLSSNLIIPELGPESGVRVTVDRSLIDDDASPGEDFEPISEMFGFRVRVENTGNVVLTDQRVTVELDEDAKIISVELEEAPDLGGRVVATAIDKKDRNFCYVIFPFLNPGHSATVSVQSVDNLTPSCWVSAGAKGLLYYDMARRRRWQGVALMFGGLVFLISAGSVLAVPLLVNDVDEAWFLGVGMSLYIISYLFLIAALVRRRMVTGRALRQLGRLFSVD